MGTAFPNPKPKLKHKNRLERAEEAPKERFKSDRQLTHKQELFVQEYLVDLCASAAAERAGYAHPKAVIGRLMAEPHILRAIARAKAERVERIKITQDEVLQELAKTGFADIKNYLSYRTEKVPVAVNGDGAPVFAYEQVIELKPSDEVDGNVQKSNIVFSICKLKQARASISFLIQFFSFISPERRFC